MVTTCRTICKRYRAVNPPRISRYLVGQKRCNHCNIYMQWEGVFCPCCSTRLRLRPRGGKGKKKFLKLLAERKIGLSLNYTFGVIRYQMVADLKLVK